MASMPAQLLDLRNSQIVIIIATPLAIVLILKLQWYREGTEHK